MAHIVKVASLTDDLITVLTGLSAEGNPSKFNTHHESTLRTLRSSNYARINQFDVQNELEGLEEKFRVYNNDDLADALHLRLDELGKRSYRWSPEILHLLLGLSEKPVTISHLASLGSLDPHVELKEPCYRWEDLVAEDPLLQDENVWRNIDYDAESSDNEGLSIDSGLESSGLTDNSTLSSIGNDNMSRGTTNVIVSEDLANLSGLETAQFWRSAYGSGTADDKQKDYEKVVNFITELQAIREVLFMVSGLPTTLFVIDSIESVPATDDFAHLGQSKTASGTAREEMAAYLIMPVPTYALRNVSLEVFQGKMKQLARYGTSMLVLRAWIRSEQSISLVQSLQSEVMRRILLFDDMISHLEAENVEPRQGFTISLAGLQIKLILMMHPFVQISEVINILDSEPYAHAFRFLELLYDRTCVSQMIGDDKLYKFLGTLFFDCFQVYLRQIRRWMEEGELTQNDRVFFISETNGDLELASLWSSRYKLRKTSNGTLHAPRFLHPATDKIFTTGKSVVVLKTLKKYDRVNMPSFVEEPVLDFRSACGSPSISLAPFPELFDVAFDRWVQSKHQSTSTKLRNCLFDDCGVRDSLDALESIYFMTDGATTSHFADILFEKLDSGKNNWNDRFTLTELAQGTIGSLPCVIAERLKVIVSAMTRVDVQRSRKSVKSLTNIAVAYSLPWTAQIIIAKATIPSYQRISNFLLQIRRSTYVLQRIRFVQNKNNVNEDAFFYIVRSRLLWFTSTLYNYLTDLVIDPNTKNMREALGKGEDVDQMVDLHRGYIKKLTEQALLGSKLEPIHKTILTILDLSIQLLDARKMEMTTEVQNGGLVATAHYIYSQQSLRHDPRAPQQGLGRTRYTASSEDDSSENESDANTILDANNDTSYADRLRKIRSQFDSLCKFVAMGLRGVARAGGEPVWDLLADKLESGLSGT